MRLPHRIHAPHASPSLGRWLAVLLFFVAAVPSAGLLWFVNRAAQNEKLAVQQRLTDAYRAHLLLVRERLEGYWLDHIHELDTAADLTEPGILFASFVSSGRADAIVVRAVDGRTVYPSASALRPPGSAAESAPTFDPAAHDHAAALLERLRTAIKVDDRPAVLGLVQGPMQDLALASARDAGGRAILPAAELHALEYLEAAPRDADCQALLERLAARLRDYEATPMPAAQRRFLMRSVQRIEPAIAFPTLAAEDLAADWLRRPSADSPDESTLRPSAVPDTWEIRSSGGRVVSLHRSDPLIARMRETATPPALAAEARLELLPPGSDTPANLLTSIPAPGLMPGWRLGFTLLDFGQLAASSSQRATSYLWIGVLVIGVVALLGSLTWGLMRRQFALTRLRNDLVANVTHELKTPLASIRLLVDTLLDAPQLNESTAREYLTLIARENLRLSRLIDNFLTFSRIERNKYTFAFEHIAPRTIVDQATAALQDRLHAPGCRFDVSVESDLPGIRADGDAMVTAIINLLDNALKYTGEEKHIAIAVHRQGRHVTFSVSDDGIGLSDREARRVFRRFYRVGGNHTGGRSGCGLGLSIVRFIVSAHGGDVRVVSAPGRGSTFTLRLPAVADNGGTTGD